MGLRAWLLRDLNEEGEDAHGASGWNAVREEELREIFGAHARADVQPVGLALSGGGIRSATFGLGVLQSLARARKLASFDYLSTVSGGGYIGSWLSAWIHRSSLKHVQEQLARSDPASQQPGDDVEPAELRWLRSYSNYLTPRLGVLSLDSLTLIAIWVRNFLLNAIVFAAFVATLLMIPRLLLPGAEAAVTHSVLAGALAALLGILGLWGIAYNLGAARRRVRAARLASQGAPSNGRAAIRGWGWLNRSSGVLWTVVVPLSLAILLGAAWLLGRKDFATSRALLAILEFAAVLALTLGALWVAHEWFLLRQLPRRVWSNLAIYGLALTIGMLVAGSGLVLIRGLWDPLQGGQRIEMTKLTEAITFGPVALLAVAVVATSVYVGLVGRRYFERSREWWARLSATFLTAAMVWLVICGLSFYAWPATEMFWSNAQRWATALGVGWVGSLFTALFMRPDKGASDRAAKWRGVVVNVAAWIVVAGLLVATAFALSRLYVAGASVEVAPVTPQTKESTLSLWISKEPAHVEANINLKEERVVEFSEYVAARLGNLKLANETLVALPAAMNIGYPSVAFAACVAVLLLFGWRIDVNKFSLHNLYKNRLVRCYLGASHARRAQQPFIGLDDADDIRLEDLACPTQEVHHQRPYHLVNTALNITHGRHLAWQERKAGSFVFAPLFCGFALGGAQGEASGHEGFQPTTRFGKRDREEPGITLGSALSTSGAAVSPNQGFSSDPAVAALLTFFNIRLGRWTSNPRGDRYYQSGPRFGLVCFLQELFGFSNEERRFIYLSDGGHFDNLGLYELVRRRCRLIVAVDAGADPERKFDDLGMAIRKCRIDFGVDIQLQVESLRPTGPERLAQDSWAEGTIHYPPQDGMPVPPGKLLYLKPTLCSHRHEPSDVLAYAARNPDFPHQTTVDQFFGESQFESYRRLGLFIGERCSSAQSAVIPDPIAGWGAPLPVTDQTSPAAESKVIGLGVVTSHEEACLASPKGADTEPPAPVQWKLALAATLTSLVVLLVLNLLRMTWLHGGPEVGCIGEALRFGALPEGCIAAAQTLIGATALDRMKLWLWFDIGFIFLYAATFALVAITACRAVFGRRICRLRIGLVGAVIVLAVLGGLADFAENVQLLSAIAPDAGSARPSGIDIAVVTVWKWRLLTIAGALALGLAVFALLRRPGRDATPKPI